MCKYPSPFSSKQWRYRSDGHDACHLRVMLPVTICFSYIVLIIRMMDNMEDFQVATCRHTPGTHTCMATKVLNLGSLKGCCSFHPMSQWCSLVATVHNCLILAENAAASTQINEEDVDQHLVSAAETSKGRRSKGSNFSPKEDVNLVKSWLEISCDPITSQKKGCHVVKDSAAIQLEEGSVPRNDREISTEPLRHYQGWSGEVLTLPCWYHLRES